MECRYTLSVLVAFLFCMTAGRAFPQAQPVIEEISIRNLGAGRIDKSFVLAHTGVRVGSELDRLNISRDVKALLATGLFSYVRAEIEPLDGGVRLIYSFRNKLRLAQTVEITGARRLPESRIRDLLRLEAGDLVGDQILGVRAQKVTEEYRKEFYPDAVLTWEIEETDHAEGLAKVRLLVKEGRRARIKRIRCAGNKGISSKTLRKVTKERAWWDPRRLFRRRRYDAGDLEAARLEIRDLYVNRGYLDAEIDIPQVTRDIDGNLIITFNIREGVAYRFGKISLRGISLFPESELKRLVTAKAGDIASAKTIETTVRTLRDYYGSRGYVNSVVRPVLDPDESRATVDLTFTVTEGRLMRIRNILIRGNERTRDKVIRRELLVYPGDIFNEIKIRRSERIISNLGFFSQVRSYPKSTRVPAERDLIFEVEEKRTGQFMLGAGFSSIDKMIGFVELSQGNFDITGWPYFTGGGQKLKLRGQFGSRRKDYEISFTEPWFLDRKLSLGFDLYRRDISYGDYDIERMGGAVSLGKALPGANRISFRYQIEKLALSDIADTNQYFYFDPPGEEYFFDREKDTVESSLRLTLRHDTRDNPFFPARGNRVSLFGSVSGGPLGYDTDIYRLGIRAAHFTPLWYRHVFSLRARYEVVEKYGDTEEIPIDNRLFLGGGRTLRGFDYRDVGPKVIRAVNGGQVLYHRPVGGRSLAMASANYTIPLVRGIRFAGFYDIGNVWREAYDLDLDDLASSAGVGIRFDIPGFPIRIDRAWVIEKDDNLTDEDAWVIWIGYDY